MKGAIQILGAFAAVQAVSATYIDWTQPFNSYDCGGKQCGGRDKFEPPTYSSEKCTPKQYTGYDFSDAPDGDLPKYDDFDFSGYKCQQSKLQRRTGRGQGNKCASSYVEPETYGNEIKCGKKFSVDEFDVSLEYESVLEFTYGMPDGSSCKHVHSCGTGITPVKNTQCGGAKSVKCKIHKSSKNKKKCKFNVHHIKFRCDTTTTTSQSVPPTTSDVASTTSVCTDYTCTAGTTTSEAVSTTSVCTDYTCTAGTTSSSEAVSTTSVCTDYTCTAGTTTSEAVPTTGPCTEYSCTAGTTTSDAAATTSVCTDYTCTAGTTSSSEAGSTSSVCTEYSCTATTTEAAPTTAPCTEYSCTAGTTTSEAAPTTSPCTEYSCTGVPTSSGAVPTTSDVYIPPTDVYVPPMNTSVPYETLPPTGTETLPPAGTDVYTTMPSVPVETGCPPVLPQCMETWTKITQCINSGDVKCLCPNPEYIKNVAACVEAWGVDDDEVAKALEYMQGLCADQIPENPAIVTCVPTYVSLPPASSGGATTITVSTTVIVPCTTEPASVTEKPGYVPSYITSVVATTVTVCPVKLVTTEPSKPVLVPGTITAPPYVPAPSTMPATIPAQYTTPVYVPTTMATAYPTGNGTNPNPPVATGAASSIKAFSSFMAVGIIGVVALIMA
ncbi:hypothetical protein H072_7297 [Dactylellina haptotyla CBS 200.50]|uniref:CFEM domain-containing protein n=1 Tax=Dactylellina haptotyla (strain CBS 200.50) TaxID=1284197 RepID=S8A7X1_DACHA|nr:hypothetical protein H072_7297 [Dactylellina haptotyla CBS 200.50]